jgi:PEP-CTERM motif
MGRVHLEIPRNDLVNAIESIIHHPGQLNELNDSARLSLAQTGSLPNTEIWNYLTWRHDLDPSRFDHYHPEFVGIFKREHQLQVERNEQPQTIQNVPSVSILPHTILQSMAHSDPPTIGTTSGPSGGGPNFLPGGGAVPEPSSIMLLAVAIVLVAAGCLAHKWRGRELRAAHA